MMAKMASDRTHPFLTPEQKERLRARAGESTIDVVVDDRLPPGTVEFRNEDDEVVASIVNLAGTESATEDEQPVIPSLPDEWEDMAGAPVNRPIFLTADPATDQGLLCYWRTTREKNKPPIRGWSPRSFWASVLTKREIDFEPACWREAMVQGAAALQAVA